jgi:hypothetical protein
LAQDSKRTYRTSSFAALIHSEAIEMSIPDRKSLTLTIAMNPETGQVDVNGPIGDRIFCFGLMELAKEAINNHAKDQQSRILLARPKIAGVS